MNILCIDYGTKKIGVAIAITPLAQPLEVIPNAIQKEAEIVTPAALTAIRKLLQEYTIEKILVGVSEGRSAHQARSFIERLAMVTPIPIDEVDETLTTQDALGKMGKLTKTKRRGQDDHLAASIMLQDYIDLG